MKKSIVLALLTSVVSFSASAASDKICLGMGDMQGSSFVLKAAPKTARIVNTSSSPQEAPEGTYKVEKDTVKGKDGKTYLSYYITSGEGLTTSLLVDEALLKDGTKGYAKFRTTGEFYSQDTYFCKDNR